VGEFQAKPVSLMFAVPAKRHINAAQVIGHTFSRKKRGLTRIKIGFSQIIQPIVVQKSRGRSAADV
jgi:hypothetical protein